MALDKILSEIEQMKSAYRAECRDAKPNEKTLLAIKGRLRDLDNAADRRIMGRKAGSA